MTEESAKSEAADNPPAEQERKRTVPECEPVFGKRGWLIVLLPFVLYLIGSQLTGYLDNSRALTIVHEQQHMAAFGVRSVLQSIVAKLEPDRLQDVRDADIDTVLRFNEETEGGAGAAELA